MDAEAIQQRKEECRQTVRAYLANRPALAFRPGTILQRVNVEGDYTVEEIRDACVFLEGLGQVKVVKPDLGATKHFQITAEGTLAHERSQ